MKLGPCSDGKNREKHLWSTDFSLYTPDGVELAKSAKNLDVKEKVPGLSYSYSMYPESSAQIAVLFDGVTAGAPLVRCQIMNAYVFNDNQAKSCV